MNLDDALEVLGVASTDDEKTVRRAYAKLAKTYRPDTHPEEFSNVRNAYELVMEALQTSRYQELNVASVVTTVSLGASEGSESASELKLKEVLDEHHQRAVSYVVNADQFGSTEENVPDTNPIQHLEDEVVNAVKATRPGDTDSENRAALLIDDYLTAASRVSYSLRDYVERFVVGLCIGDYYLPHVVREKAADLCGLSNAVFSEQRLAPWEQEFLRRFDESAVAEEFLVMAARKGPAEIAVLNNVSWLKVFMLRLNDTEANKVNQYLNWFEYTFEPEEGYVSDAFRYRWQRLQHIKPLNGITLLAFAILMAFSGLMLTKLGVPLHQFFQLPKSSMAFMAAGLAVLSWANFLLVILARPVVSLYTSRLQKMVRHPVAKALLSETLFFLLMVGVAYMMKVGSSAWMVLGGVFLIRLWFRLWRL